MRPLVAYGAIWRVPLPGNLLVDGLASTAQIAACVSTGRENAFCDRWRYPACTTGR